MASGCPLSWTDLWDQEKVRVVESRTGQRWQPQPPALHLLGVEPVLAVGLQQVLMDDLIPQRPCQLDFLPGAMQVDDVKGDGPPDVVVAAKGRVGAEGCTGTCPGSITSKKGFGGLSKNKPHAAVWRGHHCPSCPSAGRCHLPITKPGSAMTPSQSPPPLLSQGWHGSRGCRAGVWAGLAVLEPPRASQVGG